MQASYSCRRLQEARCAEEWQLWEEEKQRREWEFEEGSRARAGDSVEAGPWTLD